MPGRIRDPRPDTRARLSEALRRDGDSTQEPARNSTSTDGYEGWTVDNLRRRAAEVGIEGRSTMRKDALIEALRSR
ncbi:Rho termination factor N-terminal domain-containing protein [Cellulomonas chengniuliangii]|uniref:Rho termination factor N-terminal domain-containing protein n=1 Tax=Cellulomonas chengniuliangii TaxID=2968084 RepID=A0ABY5KWN1_9CELL|nr:Rho termination factor N-terminal domain-containing protein [Cellulomonas chengniuliangii]MCC2309138.1 Rho termination factor N-terminal domain-containing protein [Cellulomonas chengniuliangii]MCC2319412.1 Rho termination factor N-terminal domain-containing protein [Cellulomonas chengniuliangii]UUI74145.1 Rho termination factor N-terminal domain-containing protein [Cellulomonas chengniuliangii]